LSRGTAGIKQKKRAHFAPFERLKALLGIGSIKPLLPTQFRHQLRSKMERIPKSVKAHHALDFRVSVKVGFQQFFLLVCHSGVEHFHILNLDTRRSYERRILPMSFAARQVMQ